MSRSCSSHQSSKSLNWLALGALFSLLLTFPWIITAQSVLLPSTKTAIDFPNCTTIIDNHAFRTGHQSLTYAVWQMPSVTFSEDGVPLGIEVDLFGETFYWKPEGVQQNGNEYSLTGKFDLSGGYMVVSFGEHGVDGHISHPNGLDIDVISLGGYDVLLSAYNNPQIEVAIGCGTEGVAGSSVCTAPGDCQAVVHVLLLFGQAAFNEAAIWGHVVPTRVQDLATRTNDVLANSGIANKRVRISYHPVAYFPPVPMPQGGVSGVRQSMASIRTDPVANALRDQYGADIVYYMGGYPELGNGSPSGEATGIGVTSQNAYAVGSYSATSEGFTGPHEFGHLWGCFHQTAGSRCPKGYRIRLFADGTQTQTVMHTGEASSDRTTVPYFSNSSVSYQNDATGITNEYQCADKVGASMCQFADYRDTKELEVLIGFDEEVDCEVGLSLFYNISFPAFGIPGNSVSSFEWKYSFSPIFSGSNPGTIFATTASALLPSSAFPFSGSSAPDQVTVYVLLTVTTDDGVEVTWTEAFTLCNLVEAAEDEEDQTGDEIPLRGIAVNLVDFTIFPVPAKAGATTVWVKSSYSIHEPVTIKVLDELGREILRQKALIGKAATPLNFEVPLSSGRYHAKFYLSDGITKSVPLVVLY